MPKNKIYFIVFHIKQLKAWTISFLETVALPTLARACSSCQNFL